MQLAVRKPKDAKPPKKTKEAKENANPNVGKAKAKDAGMDAGPLAVCFKIFLPLVNDVLPVQGQRRQSLGRKSLLQM